MQNVRYACRQLAKSPGFTLVVVLSLALGIGACTAVFSLFNAILLRSLPVPNPQELRVVQWTGVDSRVPSRNGNDEKAGNRLTADSVDHPLFLKLRDQAKPLADLFGFFPAQEVVVRAQHEPFVATGLMVSDNFFSALGAQPFIGRLFHVGDADPGAAPGIVITHRWWTSRFASNPDLLGQVLTLNGVSFTIVGVLPENFPGVSPEAPPEFYVPMQEGSPFLFKPLSSTQHWFVRLMARLKPGTSDTQLRDALTIAFAREAGSLMTEPAMVVQPGRNGPGYDRKNHEKPIVLMTVVVALVMLIACANVAGLSLARGAGRQHELAVRVALGSSRARLVRQSLTESFILAVIGGALGVLVAVWGRDLISRLIAGSPEGLRYDLSLNAIVLGFCVSAALATAIISGLLPAWRASRVDPLDGLKARGALAAPRLRIGRILVATQIALSLVLLAGAGLYLRSLANLRSVRTGFATEQMLVFKINPAGAGYKGPALSAFFTQAQDALAAIPGVQGAAVVQYPLLTDRFWGVGFTLTGSSLAVQEVPAHRLTVGETFFATMGIPILHGRSLFAGDIDGGTNVMVVNDTFARRYFPNQDPIGHTLQIHGITWQIVGVCGDAKYENVKAEVAPTVYMSFRQYALRYSVCVNVRTTLPPLALSTAVRKAIAALDANVPVADLTTQSSLLDKNIGQERMLATLCGALAGLALLLSCIGLYGLMAYHVARRTSEIAIRMAIGAQPRDIALAVLREASVLILFGVGVGLPAVFAVTRLSQSQLYNVKPNDPMTLVAATVSLIIVVLLAALLPARRATRVDPMIALRSE
jgi:predicted permease